MMNIYASFVEIPISSRLYIHLNSGPSITDRRLNARDDAQLCHERFQPTRFQRVSSFIVRGIRNAMLRELLYLYDDRRNEY